MIGKENNVRLLIHCGVGEKSNIRLHMGRSAEKKTFVCLVLLFMEGYNICLLASLLFIIK